MVALTNAETVTGGVVGLFVVMAVVVVIRLVFRRDERWRRIRLGVFLERDPLNDDDELEE